VRLLLATRDLVVAGRSFEGFPIVLDDNCTPLEPVHSFLWSTLVEGGSLTTRATWEAYGRWIYDYFAFLRATDELQWDQPPDAGLSPVTRYRDWALGEVGNSLSTVNHRLRLIIRFYEWCQQRGLIGHLPFSYHDIRVRHRADASLAHVDRTGSRAERPSVLQKEWSEPIQFLTREQVRACRELKLRSSHRLLFDLMVRVGLRSVEARTFPAKYVFNPRARQGLAPGQMIRVVLRPGDMLIKNSKPRAVDIPYSLMADLYAYKVHAREVSRREGDDDPRELVLSAIGRPYTKGSLIEAFIAISNQVGFRVRPHMLRHTYATYTLIALRRAKDFEGDPLLYVCERLGHSDVRTTASTYLHVVNELQAQVILAHEDEIDALFLPDQPRKVA
jgi:integrase/recombinase XerD